MPVKTKLLKIYVAGKIRRAEWRKSIYGHRPPSVDMDLASVNEWPEEEFELDGEKYLYLGPYGVGCDHGCYHDYPHVWNKQDASCGQDYISESKSQVVALCTKAIKQADFVFAWIEDKTCYGTLAEIGYARGLGKTVIVSGPAMLDDLWWIYTLASFTFACSDPKEAVQRAFNHYRKQN
jgi:hypothetical protein